MRLADIVMYSLKSLKHRQMRSWLTILGIVIGIGAVISLLTIGQGFNDEVNRQLGALGSNTVFITPNSESQGAAAAFSAGFSPSAGKLFDKDAERVKRVPEVDVVARLMTGRATVEYKDKKLTASITGIEPGVFEKTTAVKMASGRFLQENDRRSVVIGDSIAYDTFGTRNTVGVNSYLTINGVKYRVIGIMEKSGGGFGASSRADSGIYMPFTDARELFRSTVAPHEVAAMVLTLREGSDMAEAVAKIKNELDASHKVKPDARDYSVIDPASIQAAVSSVLSMITAFLGAIAGISLLVGGLAIASSMFTSVIERTHEIGVLKAVGATSSDILKIFVFEAGAVGGIGGAIGVALGMGVVYIASQFGIPLAVNPLLILFGILFAVVIGLVSGFVPAKNAADLAPVDALRYD
ncbi:MacB-like periplasmic core domain protein [uncultured archaeon]|nr:MacB-like periplasmic core domain protein [uncultured archaeon]